MADKKAYHPDGKHIIMFNEQWHRYTDNRGVKYTSGTKFVGQFFPKFDAVAMSEKCSAGKNPRYAGRTPEDIRAEWRAEGQRGSTEGTMIHEYAEGLMCGWDDESLPSPISARTKIMLPHVKAAVHALRKMYTFIAAEMIVFSPELELSGMVDLVMYDAATNEIIVGDYKQNKELSEGNTWQMGFPPIDHLGDSSIEKYSLQLGLYQYIMEKESYFPNVAGYRRELIHLTPEGFTIIPLEYFYYEVCEMIKEMKK